MMHYQQFLEKNLKEASKIANDNFGNVTGTTKGEDNNQVLTQTDLAIGKFLIEQIKQTYPDHNIIDEEAGVIDNNSDYTWVIDPIDGTSNFAAGIPTYGIMVGLLKNETPIAGGIALPAFETIITAEKGSGAQAHGKQIFVTKEIDLSQTLIAYGIDGHKESPEKTYDETKLLAEIILHIRNLRNSNSAYDYGMVAMGKYGGVLNQTSKIWDNVAFQIIIEEAGGVYTDFWGQPIDYAHPLEKTGINFTFCAAAPELHKQLQAIIKNTNTPRS